MQTTLNFPAHAAVSSKAQAFIRSLLVEPEDRPSAATIQRHSWFASQPPSPDLRTSPPPYVPPPFAFTAATAIGSPFYSPVASFSYSDFARGALNTSTPEGSVGLSGSDSYASFFSSPGMSVLRPTPPRGPSEEDTFWTGMSWLPPADFFDRDSDENATGVEGAEQEIAPASKIYSPEGVPSSLEAFRARQRAFETPARQTSTQSLSRESSAGGPGHSTPTSSGRARRMVSEIEAWKEMQEYAHSIGLSTRKTGHSPWSSRVGSRVVSGAGGGASATGDEGEGGALSEANPPRRWVGGLDSEPESPVTDRLGRLELRQKRVVSELDGLEEKYKALFTLAAKET